MGTGWKDWSRSDIIYGIIAPLAVVLAIAGISVAYSFLFSRGYEWLLGDNHRYN